jgi:ABC-type transporter lipoprotein component MlaA
MSLSEQIANARVQVRKMKRATPYIFHEWQRLQSAKRALKDARDEYEAARKAWKEYAQDHQGEHP